MRKVLSKDSTPIAFDQSGEGPPIILVVGAFSDTRYRSGCSGSGVGGVLCQLKQDASRLAF